MKKKSCNNKLELILKLEKFQNVHFTKKSKYVKSILFMKMTQNLLYNFSSAN